MNTKDYQTIRYIYIVVIKNYVLAICLRRVTAKLLPQKCRCSICSSSRTLNPMEWTHIHMAPIAATSANAKTR